MGFFSRFGLIPTPPVKRPRDLLYGSAEMPPLPTLGILAAQHLATALALIVYALTTAHIGGLDAESTRRFISATIIGMAIATVLQSWGGRTGSGTMLVHMPDPILVAVAGLVCAEYGLGGMVLVCIVNGLTALCASSIVPRLRSVLPPAVAGVVVCVGGLSLIEPALTQSLGVTDAGPNFTDVLLCVVTLAVIMVLSIWGTQTMKLFALLAGLLAGVGLAALLGALHGGHLLMSTPLFGLPTMVQPTFDVPVGLLVAVGLLALMTQLDTFACTVLMQKMNDADWRRADMRMVGGGIRANALGNLCAASLGGYPSAVSSANLALCHISRSTSRWIGLTVGVLLLCFAFMPFMTRALTLIPASVIGAVGIYAAAYLVVSGIELIASRAMDARGIFMVGLAFVAGIGVMFMPHLADALPDSLQFIGRNGIVMAGATAIVLNVLFRLGSSQRRSESLADAQPGHELAQRITDFIESSGAAWGARHAAIRLATQATLEASEALLQGGARRITGIRGRFDEFNLDIELLHDGPPLSLEAPGRAAADLLEADDADFDTALEQTMAQVSHTLVQRLADRVHADERHGQASLRLHFDH